MELARRGNFCTIRNLQSNIPSVLRRHALAIERRMTQINSFRDLAVETAWIWSTCAIDIVEARTGSADRSWTYPSQLDPPPSRSQSGHWRRVQARSTRDTRDCSDPQSQVPNPGKLANPKSQIPDPWLRERARHGAPGAGLRSVRRNIARATFRMCVRKLLGINSADYAARLRQVRRPTGTPAPIPNPQSPIPNPQSPIPNPQPQSLIPIMTPIPDPNPRSRVPGQALPAPVRAVLQG